MKFSSPLSLRIIGDMIDAEIIGNENLKATGINEIHRVEEGDLVFVDHPKYYNKCLQSAASFIIINTREVEIPQGKALLFVDDPFEAYLKIVKHFRPPLASTKAISDISTIGEGTVVMPNVFIGNHVKIGSNCIIYPNVSILDYTVIGDNVVIQSGCVLGSDAFYYNTKKDREMWYKKMLSCGKVVIEDDVEMGANCTIDRGVTAETIIGKGTKMDNMVHVAHDVVIGKNCLLAAQVAIAGGTTLHDGVTLWGQVGISKTLILESGVTVLAQAGVGHNLEKGKTYWGSPADEAIIKKRELVWIKRIPEMWERLKNK